MFRRFNVALGLMALVGTAPLAAAEPAPEATAVASPAVHVSGMLFADYYWVAADHNGQYANLNGMAFRRAWLAADTDLGNGFSGRLRLELLGSDFAATTGTAWAAPVPKDAWVKYAYAAQQAVSFGIIEGVVISPVEQLWGLRSVEKTPLDLQGWENIREQGLSLTGDLGATHYGFVFSNNSNSANQGNGNGKKVGLTVTQALPANLLASVSGEYLTGFDGQDVPSYNYLLQALVGYKTAGLRAGLQYDRVTTVQPGNVANPELPSKELVSVFVVAKVWGRASAYARVDHLLWHTVDKGGETYLQLAQLRSTISILGLDYPLATGLNLQPNVEWINYQSDAGPALGNATADCIPRLTVAYTF